MSPSRREFMRSLGVVIGSLLTVRCRPDPTCYAPPIPTGLPSGDGRDRLRQPWYDLDLLARDAQDYERGEATLERLISDHRAALDDLVLAGDLDPAIVDDLQAAFEGAAHHIWRANAPITCYEAVMMPEYGVESSSDLARQAELLEELALSSAIDEATVAQARAAIERDVNFLAMPYADQQALIEAVMAAAGNEWPFPSLDELGLEPTPDAVTAAQVLVETLLGRE